jgi:hypothetical protein
MDLTNIDPETQSYFVNYKMDALVNASTSRICEVWEKYSCIIDHIDFVNKPRMDHSQIAVMMRNLWQAHLKGNVINTPAIKQELLQAFGRTIGENLILNYPNEFVELCLICQEFLTAAEKKYFSGKIGTFLFCYHSRCRKRKNLNQYLKLEEYSS